MVGPSLVKNLFLYDVFISYSRAADGKLAPAVQTGLHRLTKPWYKIRAMRAFLDKTDVPVTEDAWLTLKNSIDKSDYFILMASPGSAKRPWVRREIAHWFSDQKRISKFMICLTDGEIEWDEAKKDFNWEKTTALPKGRLLEGSERTLSGIFNAQPIWVDFREIRNEERLNLLNPEFKQGVAQLASRITGRSVDELISEDYILHKRTRRLAIGAVSALVALLVLTAGAAIIAMQQARKAEWKAYTSSIVASYGALDAGNIDTGERLLLDAPSRHKSWEFLYGAARCRRWIQSFNPEGVLHEVTLASTGRACAWFDDNRGVLGINDPFQTEVESKLSLPVGNIKKISISHKVDRVAVITNDEELQVWDTASLRKIWHYRVPPTSYSILGKEESFAHRTTHICLSPDSKLLAASVDDGKVHVWRLDSNLINELPFAGIMPGTLVFSPNMKTLAVAAAPSTKKTAEANIIRLYSLLDAKEIQTFTGHEDTVFSLCFSEDGKLLASGSADRTASVWKVKTGEELNLLQHSHWVEAVSFNPDGRSLATGARDGAIRVWDLNSNSIVTVLRGHHDNVEDVTFHSSGDYLISASRYRIFIWHSRHFIEPAILKGHEEAIESLVCTSTRFLSEDTNGVVAIWDLHGGNRIGTLSKQYVRNPEISRNEKYIAAIIDHDKIGVWNADAAEEIYRLPINNKESAFRLVSDIRFASNDDIIVFTSFEPGPRGGESKRGEIHILNLKKLANPTLFYRCANKGIWNLEVSPDGNKVAFDGDGFSIRLKQLYHDKKGLVLSGHKDTVYKIAFTPDGSHLVSASKDGEIRIWNAKNGELVNILLGSNESVFDLLFSNEGNILAAAFNDAIRLWDYSRGIQFQPIERVERGIMAFSSDNKRLFCASKGDRVIRIWDIAKGQEIVQLYGQPGIVKIMCFSPDGKVLITASDEGTICLWSSISPEQWYNQQRPRERARIKALRIVKKFIEKSGGNIKKVAQQIREDTNLDSMMRLEAFNILINHSS